MSSYPPKPFEGLSGKRLQSARHAHSDQHATPVHSRAAPHAGSSYGPPLSQASAHYESFNAQVESAYPFDGAPLTPHPHPSGSNLHHAAHDPHTQWNLENDRLQPIPRDLINDPYHQPQPYSLYPPNYHFPELRQNPRLIVPSQTIPAQIIPVMPFHRPTDRYSYPPQEHPAPMTEYNRPNAGYSNSSKNVTTGGHQNDSQIPPVDGGAMRNPEKLPASKRKRTGGTSRSAKCLCNDQQDSLIDFSTNDENMMPGQFSTTVTEDEISAVFTNTGVSSSLPLIFSTEASSRGKTSVQSGTASRSLRAKGAHSEPANGFFSHSSNNVLKQPIMVDHSQHIQQDVIVQHTHTRGDQPDGTLLWLKDYIMEGAEFDSSERDPPPRCHPNTRASIIERMIDWVNDPHREKKMRWVHGAAGVGKSAIIQTAFERLPEETRGGSVFFSRPNGRNIPNEVFPSIAYQLAVRDLPYRAYLKELMLKDPRSLEKSMKEQFRILFEVPFAKQKLLDGQDALVIALDGLDECGGDPTYDAADPARSRGRSSEFAQREIVELISDFIRQHASVPLIWVIASRPEIHLQATFAGEKVESTFAEEEIPVNSVEACQDVERYLNSEFTRIRKDHDDLITTTPWPSSQDFLLIITKASGLFIFAQVVIRFIDDSNPIEQLKYALAAISKAPTSEVAENPLVFLDAMYAEIVSKVPPKLLEPAKKIISTIAQFEQHRVTGPFGTLPAICNILNIRRDVAITALRHLHSVLRFSKAIKSKLPRFYHTSFRDFLEDESRSHEYSIEEVKTGDDLFEGVMRFYGKRSLDDNLLPWPREGNSKLIVDLANKEYCLSDLLHFSATLFSRKFVLSATMLSRFLLTHDFSLDLCNAFVMAHLEEKMLRIHEQLGIACYKSVDSLGITSDALAQCKISQEEGGDCYTVSLNKSCSSSEDENITAIRKSLRHWIEATPRDLVTVWGREPFKRLGVIDLSFEYSDIDYQLLGRSSHYYRENSLRVCCLIAVIGF